jgi:hypothetical protein
MAIIEFSNGKRVEFNGTPTQADIEAVASQLGIYNAPQEAPTGSLRQRIGGIASKVIRGTGSILGGNQIGELAGAMIAPAFTKAQELTGFAPKGTTEQLDLSTPTKGQIAGDIGKIATTFLPYGRMAAALGGKALGNIAVGAAGGFLADVSQKATEGVTDRNELLTPGLGTAIGGAIPAVAPVTKGVGKLVTEGLGVSTGVGSKTLSEFGSAILAGGKQADEAVKALRGVTTPEEIVNNARGALAKVIEQRNNSYVEALSNLKSSEVNLDISPIIKTLDDNLERFNIKPTVQDGVTVLDFSRSPLRFNKQAQQEINTIFEEMKSFGTQQGDRTVIGVDSLKRAFGDLFSDSSEARAFVQSMRNSTREILDQVPGYNEMADNYANSTDFIREIQKGLSLGDKASIDTGFRKLTTTLRTNNEFREQLLKELEAASGATLIPQIAGQQLSEVLPRGLIRTVGGVAGAGGLLSGVGILPMVQAALVTSPRLIGEIINALGFTARQVKKVLPAITPAGFKFPGDVIFDELKGTGVEKAVKEYFENPKIGMSVSNIKKDVLNSFRQASFEEKSVLSDFTDWQAGELKLSPKDEKRLIIDAREIAQKYKFNVDVSDKTLAGRIGDLLEATGFYAFKKAP